MELSEILATLNGQTPAQREEVARVALGQTKGMRFVPNPGPQTMAYMSPADVLLYGGQAGGGKTGLLIGVASQEHLRGIIFRRELAQTDGLEEFGRRVIADAARFVGSPLPEWTWPDGRSLQLAGMQQPGDWNKHAGRERDFIGFDEAGEFLEEQVASLLAWNRGPLGQRCRVILASNPPRTSDGAWLMRWFAPWLDAERPDRAAAGELRYAVMIAGKPVWQAGPGEVDIEGERYKPLSFTFIPARLSDNPERDTPEYRARLNSLPEPLRSQLLKGLFDLGGEDNPWQVMPTQWVQAAMKRWTDRPPAGVPMCSLGVDVAQGGADKTAIAMRHDGWYWPIITIPGAQTPGGTDVAGFVIAKRRDQAKVVIDVGGGWGGDAYAHLKANEVDCLGYMGVKESARRTSDSQLRFFNVRAEAYWRFREALNPDQPGGSCIALPTDLELLAELCCPTFEVVQRGGIGHIKVLPKDGAGDCVKKRLGRSPDKGDAVVMAWYAGARAATDMRFWEKGETSGDYLRRRASPKVIMGHEAARRHR